MRMILIVRIKRYCLCGLNATVCYDYLQSDIMLLLGKLQLDNRKGGYLVRHIRVLKYYNIC